MQYVVKTFLWSIKNPLCRYTEGGFTAVVNFHRSESALPLITDINESPNSFLLKNEDERTVPLSSINTRPDPLNDVSEAMRRNEP